MLSLLPVMSKYGAAALFGAATKTYFDYKRDKVSLYKLAGLFLLNSVFAMMVGSVTVYAFLLEMPDKSHFAYMVAYLSGAIGINIVSGLLTINWGKVIQSRVNK